MTANEIGGFIVLTVFLGYVFFFILSAVWFNAKESKDEENGPQYRITIKTLANGDKRYKAEIRGAGICREIWFPLEEKSQKTMVEAYSAIDYHKRHQVVKTEFQSVE